MTVGERGQVGRDALGVCEVRAVADTAVDDGLDVGDPREQDLLVVADERVVGSGQQQRGDVDVLQRLGPVCPQRRREVRRVRPADEWTAPNRGFS